MKKLLTWRTNPRRALRAISLLALALGIAVPRVAPAQQPAPAPQAPPPAQPQVFPQSPDWANLPKMVLDRQFAGPLQDTVIQRWRDPADGTVCYIYLPITAAHSPPMSSGFVQYGSNAIGSISCVAGVASAQRPTPPPPPAAVRKQ